MQARASVAFRYAPAKKSDREIVAALAAAYEQERLPVLEAVQDAADASIGAFADAFRIRRD